MEYKFKQISKDKDKTVYEVTVEFKELLPYQEAAYIQLSKNIKLEGFRPGKAPRAKIMQKIGSEVIDMSIRTLLPNVTAEIIQKEKARPIAAPDYELVSLDPEKGIVYKFTYTDYPVVKLGDFSKIKVVKEEPKVTDEDADLVIKNIVRSSIKPERLQELGVGSQEPEDAKPETRNLKQTTAKAKSKNKTRSTKGDGSDFILNDEIVKELGYKEEKTLKELRESVKKKLIELKQQQAEQDYADKVLVEAVKLSKFDIPEFFIQRELESQEHQFIHRLEELKLDADTYLKTQGSTLEKKRAEWKENAEKSVGMDLVLISIADQNGGVATDQDVENEINSIEDPIRRGQYRNDNAREYVRTILTRQRGLGKLLEMVNDKKAVKSKK
jgi:trigger factor